MKGISNVSFFFFYYAVKPATGLLAACTLLCILAVQREIHMLFLLKITRICNYDTRFMFTYL